MDAIENDSRNDCGIKMYLSAGTDDNRNLNLFENWIDMWCADNFQNDWSLHRIDKPTRDCQFILVMSDPSEAIYFKLVSPSLNITEVMTPA